MPAQRIKRSIQIPLLKAAALALAEQGEQEVVSNIPITKVQLDTLYFWL